jgi:hypothetical protein
MFGRNRVGPLLDSNGLDLYGEAARATDQVVVVTSGGTGSVEALTLLLERVCLSLCSEVGECAIYRR